jgi:hypothetical protein
MGPDKGIHLQVVKAMLHNAGLNVPFRGGLSSYSVFLLVCVAHDSYVAMFQQQTCTSVPLSNQNYSTDSLDSVKSCNSGTNRSAPIVIAFTVVRTVAYSEIH